MFTVFAYFPPIFRLTFCPYFAGPVLPGTFSAGQQQQTPGSGGRKTIWMLSVCVLFTCPAIYRRANRYSWRNLVAVSLSCFEARAPFGTCTARTLHTDCTEVQLAKFEPLARRRAGHQVRKRYSGKDSRPPFVADHNCSLQIWDIYSFDPCTRLLRTFSRL